MIKSSCFFVYTNKVFLHHIYTKKRFYEEFDLQWSFLANLWISEIGGTRKTNIQMALKSRIFILDLDHVKLSLEFFFLSCLTLTWQGKGRSALPKLRHWILARNIIIFKKPPRQFLNLPEDSKNAKKKILISHWFEHLFDNLPLVGQICPSLASM